MVIVARRERPIMRVGQVEKVLQKFEIGPARHERSGPVTRTSTFHRRQNDDGSQIELEIVLHDDAQAPSLVAELRGCGFVASSGNFALTH